MNTWDWYLKAVDHLRSQPRTSGAPGTGEHGDPDENILLAVALYWARAQGTEWKTGKRVSHSQRNAADRLGLGRNSVNRAIQFWIDRGYMRVAEKRVKMPLVVDLVVPTERPVEEDFPDKKSWLEAMDEYWKAA